MTTFEKVSGYDLWHRRLGHTPHQNIKDSIIHSIGLEDLSGKRFQPDEKCPSCMLGKSTLENYPDSLEPALRPLMRVNMDMYSSSITSIEGHNYAVVFSDSHSEYRWHYGMKTKDETLAICKRWFAEITELRTKYPLLVVMRDNSGENTSRDLNDFFTDNGVKNYFSTPYEQWQNGSAESSINSITLLGRTVMAESGLGGPLWFSATTHGVNCRNATFKKRIGTTPHEKIFGVKKDVSKFRPFGCRAYMHMNKDRREKGRHAPKAIEVIHLGFATDCITSGYKFLIEGTGKHLISNQAKFDEDFFPYRNRTMVDEHIDNLMKVDILTPEQGQVQWINFAPDTDLNNFEKIHSGGSTDSYIMRSLSHPNICMRVKREDFFRTLLQKRAEELAYSRVFVARLDSEPESDLRRGTSSGTKGLPGNIDPNKPPKNFKDAMQRIDRQEWAEAYDAEYQGFLEHGTLKIVRPEPGVKILGTTTRTEYKVVNGALKKRKVRLCAMGNQQKEGIHYRAGELYAPVMKATEVRLFLAKAAQMGLPVFKSDTKQAFLNGDIGAELLYIRPPDWWPELVPEGHVLQLMKSMYGTRQAARQWHVRISSWMEEQGYFAVNSEKTIFMKRVGDDWIMHGLYVDDMIHASTSEALKQQFIKEYTRDFEITLEETMTSFLGLEIEQGPQGIDVHLDTYIQETIDDYGTYFKKPLKPKKVPMQPGVVLEGSDCPELPDPREQKIYRSIVAKLQFASTWVRCDTAFATSQLARYCASAGPSHWAALRHLMGYLVANTSFKLHYRRGGTSGLDGFADADWGNSESRRSTTGMMARFNKGTIYWRSKMQKSVSLSTAEAEYYAASEMAIEILYLRNLLANMGFAELPNTPVYEDNTACIEWGNHVIGGRERAKHIDIRKHFAHEVIQNQEMRLIKVDTANQLADIFTKPLPYPQFQACIQHILRKQPEAASGICARSPNAPRGSGGGS